ncbi:MAG: saccharopine dehydrogenase C-terminal domain-containing protein [Kiritimatiellia bacterium]
MPPAFYKKILLLGYGTVGRCFLPLLMRKVRVTPENVTVIDMADPGGALGPMTRSGIAFKILRITRHNLDRVLAAHAGPGDLIVDLARNIDCFAILARARDRGALYLNASIEGWPPEPGPGQSCAAAPEYQKYTRLLAMQSSWAQGQPTAVLDHGANPGLISHFARAGLRDLALRALREGRVARRRRKNIENSLANRDWAALALGMGVRVIHCSETDTQTPARPKSDGQFVGTWSVEGLAEESVAPAEIGWGTHEKELPPRATLPYYGPQNQIILPRMGMNTLARSWVPGGEFAGMIITHGESFTLSNLLTLRSPGGAVRYRPSVYYVYLPPNETMASLHELRCRGYRISARRRVMRNEIRRGRDSMGALIMGHAFKSWWTGSILGIDAARRILPGHNATAIQVAAGAVAAAAWIIKNPAEGLRFPEDLPFEEILAAARAWLGKFVSRPCAWSPLDAGRFYRPESAASPADRNCEWQFNSFLIDA